MNGKASDRRDEGVGLRVLLRRPSAFVPLLFSLAALAVVASHIAIYGGAREADEGAAAHLWQLLMVGQAPVVVAFALKWLPRAPRPALLILIMQLAAAICAAVPVFFLGL